MSKFDQLSLAVQLSDFATFDNFYLGANDQLVSTLKQDIAHESIAPETGASGQSNSCFYIWGADGSGRSHILQAACHLAKIHDLSSIYLPLNEVIEYGPESLDGLEGMDVVCLDNIGCIVGNSDWEQALFHFFNKVRDLKKLLIVAAKLPPKQLGVTLPDLTSRLGWGQVFQLHLLQDEEKLDALQMRSSRRGIELTREVAQYILHRGARDMTSLFSVLEQLDDASLQARRRLTIPFVKDVMAW